MFEKQGVIMPVLSKREKAMLLILLVILLAFLHYRYLLGPQIKYYLSVKAKLDRLESQVARTSDIVDFIRSETDAVNAADRRLEEAKTKYFVKQRESSNLFILGRWAAGDKIAITSYQPGLVANKGSYLEMPLKIGLRGGYQDLLILIRQIEEMGNLAEIRFLSIKKYTPASFVKDEGEPGVVLSPGAYSEQDLVFAELNMVMYSDATQQGQVVLNEISTWAAGRPNAFLPPPGANPVVTRSSAAPVQSVARPIPGEEVPAKDSGQNQADQSTKDKIQGKDQKR